MRTLNYLLTASVLEIVSKYESNQRLTLSTIEDALTFCGDGLSPRIAKPI